MSYPHKDIIDQIRLERKRQGITQTELANLLGCPQPSIVRIETKKLSPTIGMLQKICDILGMDIVLVKKEVIKKNVYLYIDSTDENKEFALKQFKKYFKEVSLLDKLPTHNNDQPIYSEKECIELLKDDKSFYIPHNDKDIELIIKKDMNIYFGFTKPSLAWKIGNLLTDDIDDLVRKIVEEDVPATLIAKLITIKDLVKKYGDINSNKSFSLEKYKMHLLRKHLKSLYSNIIELERLASKYKFDIPNEETLKALKEVEEMKKHPEEYETYHSVEELIENLLNDNETRTSKRIGVAKEEMKGFNITLEEFNAIPIDDFDDENND